MRDAWIQIDAWMALDGYIMAVLVIILFSMLHIKGRKTARERIFRNTILYVMLLTICHTYMSFGEILGVRWLQTAATLASFAFNPGILLFWLVYVQSFLGDQDNQNSLAGLAKNQYRLLLFLLVLNILIACSNPWTHLYFYYDSAGVYHRGQLFLVRYGVCIAAVIGIMSIIIRKRDLIGQQTAPWLVFTPIFPAIGAFLQPHTHMLGLELAGITFSCMMLHLYVQGRVTAIDALTGLANRRELERRFDRMCDAAQAGHAFGAVMIDIDRFKVINDTYGHVQGDNALIALARAMENTFGSTDTLVRLSGDEFLALIDTDSKTALEDLIAKLRKEIARVSRMRNLDFSIEASVGYGLYDPERFTGQDDFIQYLDEMLYAEKAQKGAMRAS